MDKPHGAGGGCLLKAALGSPKPRRPPEPNRTEPIAGGSVMIASPGKANQAQMANSGTSAIWGIGRMRARHPFGEIRSFLPTTLRAFHIRGAYHYE